MTFVPLIRLPWRNAHVDRRALPRHWADSTSLTHRIDAWRLWLADKPRGHWLLYQSRPAEFCAALAALWESGRVAVLPADNRPETLARLAETVDGTLPEAPDVTATRQHDTAALATPEALAPTATAVVLYTSGSTGNPVRLAKRFDQLETELAAHARLWPLADSGVISQVSHQHIYGLLTGVLHPLCAGAPFYGDPCRYPEGLIERLKEAGEAHLAPVIVSSPAQLSRLPDHLEWHESPRPTRVFSSGARLALAHAQHTEALLKAPVIEIYGSTESGGIAQRRQTQDTVWQALPGVELSFSKGRLALRSPFLEAPQQWWHQPDRVVPRHGGFELLGRADRLAKIAGKRVSLNQIECLLAETEEVREARCVDLERADGRLGVIVVVDEAFIPHQRETRHALISRLRSRLSSHLEGVATPRYWRFVDTLPSNAQGKLDHELVQRLFADLDDHKAPRWLGEYRADAASCCLSLEVPERLIFLEGHFDNYPVVPGVVMVQWAVELAGTSFGELDEFKGIERLKFKQVLRPGARFTLQLTRRAEGIAFTIDSQEGRHCTGQVRLQTHGGEHG
ncbi:MAG: AMP-binding protein [Pseudomonadota bacterium]